MKLQKGRSMIEMLAVLAIIGVITIGSYSLYRRAVDTHKANSIFDDVNRFEFVISERVFRTPRGFFDKADFSPASGFEMTAYNEPELASHHISVMNVPKNVCQIVLDKGEDKYVMYANNLIFEGDSSICRTTNEMRFYFGDTSDLCSFPEPNTNQKSCSDGCLCDGDNECKPDIYTPDSIPKMTEETVCCPNDNNIVACNGKCIEDCGTGKTLDRKTCQCVCADTMKQMDENGNCICKPSGSDVPLMEGEDGECKCSNPKYIWIPSMNRCTLLDCPEGDGGSCKLEDKTCGVSCQKTGNANEVECNAACRPSLFDNPDTFGLLPKSCSGYWAGIRITGTTNCYDTKRNKCCFNNNANFDIQCCYADSNGTCVEGSCDENLCEIFENIDSNVQYVPTGTSSLNDRGGCLFSNGASCWPTTSDLGQWSCIRHATGVNCGTGCTLTELQSGFQEGNCASCKEECGGQGDADGDYCCVKHTETYSDSTQKVRTICMLGRTFYFKEGETYDACGLDCKYTGLAKNNGEYTITSIACNNAGACQPFDCHTGWTYAKTSGSGNFWGCEKGDMHCENRSSAASGIACYWKGGICGKLCQYDGTECGIWSQKSCAPSVTREVNGVNVTKPACIYGRKQGTENKNDYDYDCWCQSGNVDEATNICCPKDQIVRGSKCVVNQ